MYKCIPKFKIHQILLPIITIGTSITSHAYTAQDELVQLKQQVAEFSNRIQAIQQRQLTNDLHKEQPIITVSNNHELKPFRTNNGAEVNLYGYIRADASYQAAGAATIHHHINATPLKDTVEAQQQKDRLRTTVSATRIGINLKTPTPIGDVSGKFETDFYSGANKDQFRIRHAYLTYDNWLIGQTWSNFIAPEYTPETIDAGTFVGGSLQRSPIIRYTHKKNDKTNVVLSIEDPKYTATSDPDNEMRLPALVGRINRSFDNGSVVSARSFVAEKKTSEDEELSWGIGLGGKYQITPETMLKADYYHVKGDGRFLFWTNTGYVIDDQKKMHSNEFDVISLGLTHQLTPKFRSTFGYGYMQAEDNNTFAKIKYTDSTQNKSLWQGWINAVYNPFKPVSLGLEYAYGERETFDGRNGVDSRINMLATYEF